MAIPATELILNPDGSVYHLALLPEDIAPTIIFVGDPDRVNDITRHFETIRVHKHKREFHTQTGTYKGKEITVISTGIGTDNIDIVLNELDALANIQLNNRTLKPTFTPLNILRLGTCGGLQAEFAPGTLVYSQYSIGMDGLLDYYKRSSFPKKLTGSFQLFLEQAHNMDFEFYTAEADTNWTKHIKKEAPEIEVGITVTAKGFYGPQGRSLGRIPVRNPKLVDIVSKFHFEGKKVLNLEMETAGILGLGKMLGHRCASLSVILANRVTGNFSENPAEMVNNLIQKGLDLIVKMN